MKFTSIAMLAVAAIPFLSMVSAQTLTELLTAECIAPTPAPTSKGKGTKGEDRRQLQAKSGGKGSKSGDSDSDSACTGKFVATTPGGTSVFDACDLIPTPTALPVAADAIGTISGNRVEYLPGGFLPFSFAYTVTLLTNAATTAYFNEVRDACELDLPETPFGATVHATSAETAPIESSLVVRIGQLTVDPNGPTVGPGAQIYEIYYVYACVGSVDYSGLPSVVADYYAAYFSEGEICSADELVESGKKGDGR